MPDVDFTSAYRDATKGSTLKALAARRAEMQAALATARPREVKSPEQAIASVADTISGSIREGRLANQEAQGRARFAQLLAGGLAPDEIGEAMGLDPETTMKYQERTWAKEDTDTATKARQAELAQGHSWDVEAASARVQAEKDAAAAAAADAARRQDDQQAAALTLADHNATIEEKQVAQKVIDDAKAAATAVTAERETTKLSQQGAAEIAKTQAEQDAKIAQEKAAQDAAMADPAAKVKLAVEGGFLSPEEGKSRIDAINAEAAKKGMSAGLEEKNKKFAADALDWEQQGSANINTQISQIRNALGSLNTMKKEGAWDAPGKVMGTAEKVLPDWAMPWIGSDTIKARDSIRSAVQSSLKSVLGSQYTEREGVQLLERAFSTSVDTDENIRRAKLIMDQIQTIAKTKQEMVDYYNKNNQNLAGYTGPGLDTAALDMLDFGEGGDGQTSATDTAAPADDYKEGDVVSSPGQPDLILRGGKWVPVQ